MIDAANNACPTHMCTGTALELRSLSSGCTARAGRRELPIAAAGLADLMREFSLDLIVWPYAERVSDAEALVNWYRSRRACKQNALVVRVGTASQKGYAFTLAIRAW